MYSMLSIFHYTGTYQETLYRRILDPECEVNETDSVRIEMWHMIIWMNIREFDRKGPVLKKPMDVKMHRIAHNFSLSMARVYVDIMFPGMVKLDLYSYDPTSSIQYTAECMLCGAIEAWDFWLLGMEMPHQRNHD